MIPEIDTYNPHIYVSDLFFPIKWTLFRTNVVPHRMIDPAIFVSNNSWWLIGVNLRRGWHDLSLYESKNPFSRWENLNTVRLGRHLAVKETESVGVRAGGGVFTYNGNLYRVVQNTYNGIYGATIDLYKIIGLSILNAVKQQLVPQFRKNLRNDRHVADWNRFRFHHADIRPFVDTNNNNRPMFAIVTDGNDDIKD